MVNNTNRYMLNLCSIIFSATLIGDNQKLVTMTKTVSICIFARNEAKLLPRCVSALQASSGDLPWHAHILVNGCTDDTLEVAHALGAAESRLTIHSLPVGDKANAWNDYVFRIADADYGAHIFLDGDIVPSEDAIDALWLGLHKNPDAFGASALPATGRSRRSWATRLYENHYLSGNLYALSGNVIKEFRNRNLTLPIGAKGEDGLITYLLLTDLNGGRDDQHTHRIIHADNASFEFDSIGLNLQDLKIYIRRLRRYSERHFQKEILYRILKEQGVSAMPENIDTIYTPDAVKDLKPRLDLINFMFDQETLKRLRSTKAGPKAAAL